MTLLGWSVVYVDAVQVFIRWLPVIGTIAKIQRPSHLPYLPLFIPVLKKYKVNRVSLDPGYMQTKDELKQWIFSLKKWVSVDVSLNLQTKTILVDVTPAFEVVFSRLTSAKRRAVRRAEKNNIVVTVSHDIDVLILTKSRAAGFLGGITTTGLRQLWKAFSPKNAAILLAFQQSSPIGGLLILFYNKTAYYWIAGATKKGKKLFAPTLLVFEALKLAHKKRCTFFDFIGVWDERLPKRYTNWFGFTKFKEGFGGKPVYYPI